MAAKASTQGLDGVFFSPDNGHTFTELPDVPNLLGYTVSGADLGGQGFYDLTIAVDPLNADHIVVGGVNLWSTADHGAQWSSGIGMGPIKFPEVHADHHAVTFLPGTSDWVSAHDGGVPFTQRGLFAGGPLSEGLDIAQVYRIGHAEERPDRLLAGWQDNGINALKDGVHARVRGADGFCPVHAGPAGYGLSPRSTSDAPSARRTPDGAGRNGLEATGRGWMNAVDWNTPMASHRQNPNRVFVAKRRLYWTDDGGMIWFQTNALPGTA